MKDDRHGLDHQKYDSFKDLLLCEEFILILSDSSLKVEDIACQGIFSCPPDSSIDSLVTHSLIDIVEKHYQRAL